MPKVCLPPFTRFVEKIKINPITHCWEWQGTKSHLGYGQFRADGRRDIGNGRKGTLSSPHRFAYTALVGPIPEGKEIDHLCRNRACCNPDHLEAVTHQENAARGDAFGKKSGKWKPRPRPTHCKRGHEYTPENTHHLPSGSIACRACNRISCLSYQAKKRQSLQASPVSPLDT